MKRYLILSFTLLTFEAFSQKPADFSKVKAIINEQVNDNKVPAIAIAVVKDGKIIWEEGFGSTENKRATADTPFSLASVSKTITATAVMKLVEQKKINIDDPINKYLKGAKLSSSAYDPNEAKIRLVMSHESGLTTFNSWCRTDSATCAKNDDEYISRYAVMVRKPGTGFDYSNLGYGMLDRMIRDVSGKSFGNYLKDEIFEPLGMKNSFLDPHGHHYTAGGSSVYSSAHDLATFAMLHLNDLKERNNIISQSSIEKMRDTLASGTNEYGLGWWIKNDFHGYRSFLAQGGNSSAQAWLQIIPSEDMAVIVLANVGYGPWQIVIEEAYAAVLPKFKLDESFPVSKWTGILRTYKGDLPITFVYNGARLGKIDVGEVKNIVIKNIEPEPKFIAFKFEGDLHLEDLGNGPCNLHFYLRLENPNTLRGSMETRASTRPDTPTLPFWVELSRVKE